MNLIIMNTKRFFSVSFILIITGLLSCNKKEKDPEKTDPINNLISLSPEQMKSIQLDTARLIDDVMELNLNGKVSFDDNKVTKVFPLVSGTVQEVNVSLGDYVKKGTILAIVKSPDISDIQIQYQAAQANLNIAQRNLDIAKELYRTNVNSEKEYLNSQNDFKLAQGQVNKLKQQLNILGSIDNGADAIYKILAPLDGYIVEKNVNEGIQLRSDNASNLFTISSLKTVWVLADVYESDISRIRLGESVEIYPIAYPDKIFKGNIQEINSLLDPQSKVLKARIILDNPEGLLKPEMFAVVKVYVKQAGKVIAVPTKSVVMDNNNYYVMVQHAIGSFEKRPVKIERSLGKISFIKGGLKPGEIVVSDGSLLVLNYNNI